MSLLVVPLLASAAAEIAMRQHVREYADCVVKKRGYIARQAFVDPPDNREITRRYPQLIIGECASSFAGGGGVQIRFSGDTYQYALAEALYRRYYQVRPESDFKAIPALDHGPEPIYDPHKAPTGKRAAEEYQRIMTTARASYILGWFGECVVRADPLGSASLLGSKEGSAEEGNAFAILKPALAGCLIRGQQLAFSRYSLRGTIALNYIRLAAAASGIPHA